MSFQYILPTDEQKELMQLFRDKFESLSQEIEDIRANTTQSRGEALCQTKLEEAAFWLNKAITSND